MYWKPSRAPACSKTFLYRKYYKSPHSLKGEKQIGKNDLLVVNLKELVDKQYEEGRVTVLTDEELISLIKDVCEQYKLPYPGVN